MCEMMKAIRDTIGSKGLIIVRLNGVELMDEYGGNSPEECLEFMKLAEQAGVDMISVVAGWHESRTGALGRDLPHDHWLSLADAAKKAVQVPIAFGPRLADPRLAEASLASLSRALQLNAAASRTRGSGAGSRARDEAR